MLKITNALEFSAGIDRWLEEVDDLAVGALRGLSVKLFEAVLENSPQFSGNAVANWRYSVNGKDTSSNNFFKQIFNEANDPKKGADIEPFSKENRNSLAKLAAVESAAGREKDVNSLSDVIYISNSVDYADWLSTATEQDLREVNHIGHLISHSVMDVAEGHLFLNTAKTLSLGQERIT